MIWLGIAIALAPAALMFVLGIITAKVMLRKVPKEEAAAEAGGRPAARQPVAARPASTGRA